mmetsp:Transcript_62356/g.71502  ORF Transcript_62356/g.71502 Transcript_62356/m.71502 type:complete len:699 (-) Transcript_62356:196-2292(-)
MEEEKSAFLNHQHCWSRICRQQWTPQMKRVKEKSENELARQAMIVMTLCVLTVRIGSALVTGFEYTWVVLIWGGLPLLIWLVALWRNIKIKLLRFSFHVMFAITLIPILSLFNHVAFVGLFMGLVNVLLLVECYIIIRNVFIECLYIFSQMVVFLFLVARLDSVDASLRMRMFVPVIMMAVGSIICSVCRANVEAEMFEARYRNNDLRAIINQIRIGIMVKSSNRLILTNPAFESQIQQLMEDDGSSISIEKRGDLIQFLEEQTEVVKEEGNEERIVQRGDTSLSVFKASINCFDEQAELLVVKDVTPTQKAIQELKRLDQLKNNLIRTVSHDYRTPLNAIVNGLITISDHNEMPNSLKKVIHVCQQASKFLLYLVNDLLDYYQLKTAVFNCQVSKFNLREMVLATVELLNLKAKPAGISLEPLFESSLPEEINNDEDRFRQILINLVVNAIKYSPYDSKVQIKLSRSERTEEVMIEVIDHGLGIKQEDQKTLFQEFGRVLDPNNLAINPKGVGLGLWISQKVATQIGSGISVDSTFGKGSKFAFSVINYSSQPKSSSSNFLDRPNLDEFAQVAYSEGGEEPQDVKKRTVDITLRADLSNRSVRSGLPRSSQVELRVLVVDDESFNQIVLEQILNTLGVGCDIAGNPDQGLKLIEDKIRAQDGYYTTIIIDYDMPLMGGPELITLIRQMEVKESLSQR